MRDSGFPVPLSSSIHIRKKMRIKNSEISLLLLHVLMMVEGYSGSNSDSSINSAYSNRNKTRAHRRHHFHYADCGSDPDRPIRVVGVHTRPAIIRSPGRLKLSVRLNVTKQLPDTIAMDVAMSKHVFGIPLKIPCYKNIGTCHYKDVCGFLQERFGDRCPGPLHRRGLPCTCPQFLPGIYSMRRLLIRIPKIEGILTSLAMGEYQGSIRLTDEVTRAELGCISVSFTMRYKKKYRRRRKNRNLLYRT